jgi:DNA-binding NarL/FixJ family response regulator
MTTAAVVPARVLIVEDSLPFLKYLVSIIRLQTGLTIVGQAQDGLIAVHFAKSLQPDLILLDVGLPGLNGIDAARQIRELAPDAKIVFVTQESSPEVVEEAIKTGACGYVLKARAEQDLVAAIENVCRGQQFVSDGLQGR